MKAWGASIQACSSQHDGSTTNVGARYFTIKVNYLHTKFMLPTRVFINSLWKFLKFITYVQFTFLVYYICTIHISTIICLQVHISPLICLQNYEKIHEYKPVNMVKIYWFYYKWDQNELNIQNNMEKWTECSSW